MPLAYQDVPSRLRQRCCLVCGYDGPELQGDTGDRIYRCPACDADLYARPPRSYAELEGFVPPSHVAHRVDDTTAQIKIRRHWARSLLTAVMRWLGTAR